MKFKCVIFDLDGTLVNTLADIADSTNRALAAHGFPPVPEEEYVNLVGWGIRRLAFLALPAEARNETSADAVAEAVAADAARFYAERPLVHAAPYPGIGDLLAELKRRKIKTAVLSNKPDPVTQLVINGLFPMNYFDAVLGERADVPRKPNPFSTWELLLDLGIPPRETIFAGDSEIDMETALAAECHALGVSWGFRSRDTLVKAGAQRIIDRPEELLTLVRDTWMDVGS
jgi:phosphoglycolate phosphatase